MTRETFVEKRFGRAALQVIRQANAIIAEYEELGFTLTLRQLYYQFVARALIPNKPAEYKRLGAIVSDARLAGMIDWEAIEDRTRALNEHSSWGSPQDILRSAAQSFRLDPWLDQDRYVEVWIEKDALTGVIEPVCNRWRIPYFASKGYSSQSASWRAGKRFEDKISEGKEPIVLHLGDHDPSGLDMTRDNEERLQLLTGEHVEVRRLALNMDQVREYNPPPNPAKESDSRIEGYFSQYRTRSSWELDALEPTVIDGLIEKAVRGLVDLSQWDESLERERKEGRGLFEIVNRYEDVKAFLAKPKKGRK